jgi:hypothetical protein
MPWSGDIGALRNGSLAAGTGASTGRDGTVETVSIQTERYSLIASAVIEAICADTSSECLDELACTIGCRVALVADQATGNVAASAALSAMTRTRSWSPEHVADAVVERLKRPSRG